MLSQSDLFGVSMMMRQTAPKATREIGLMIPYLQVSLVILLSTVKMETETSQQSKKPHLNNFGITKLMLLRNPMRLLSRFYIEDLLNVPLHMIRSTIWNPCV